MPAHEAPSVFDAPQQAQNGPSDQSHQFNSWLDRALPRLMQYLGDPASAAVTSPGSKAKH